MHFGSDLCQIFRQCFFQYVWVSVWAPNNLPQGVLSKPGSLFTKRDALKSRNTNCDGRLRGSLSAGCSWARHHDGSFQAAMVQTPKKPKTKKSSNTLDCLNMSNEKRAPGCLGCIGDEILCNYMGILISQYKDPCKFNQYNGK